MFSRAHAVLLATLAIVLSSQAGCVRMAVHRPVALSFERAGRVAVIGDEPAGMHSVSFQAYEAALVSSGLFRSVYVGFQHPTDAAVEGTYVIDLKQQQGSSDEDGARLHVCIWAAVNFIFPLLLCGLATISVEQHATFTVTVHDVSGLAPQRMYDARARQETRAYDLSRAVRVMRKSYRVHADGRSGGWGTDSSKAKFGVAREVGRRLVYLIGRDLGPAIQRMHTGPSTYTPPPVL